MGHLGRAWWELHIFCKKGATTFSGFSSKKESTDMAGKVFCKKSPSRCRVYGCSVGHLYPPMCHHSNSLYSIFFFYRYFNFPKDTWRIHLTYFSNLQDQTQVWFFNFLYPAAVRVRGYFSTAIESSWFFFPVLWANNLVFWACHAISLSCLMLVEA